MSKETVLKQAIEGLEKAKAELNNVSSMLYAHEEVWSGDVADDIKQEVSDINDEINDLKESIKEGVSEEEEGAEEGEGEGEED